MRAGLVPLELAPMAEARALSWAALHSASQESRDAIHDCGSCGTVGRIARVEFAYP